MDKLGLEKVYISSFFNILWNSPEIVHRILVNSEKEVVKKNLAPFIVNNLYCNLLSGNYMENNLLFIITRMLKDEIDKLENINQVDNFLEDTKCGYLLAKLRKMPDIQIYFKKVIFKTVEKIERNSSFREINFNVQQIYKEIMKLKLDEEKKSGNKNLKEDLDEVCAKLVKNKTYMDSNINYSREDSSIKINKRNEMFIKHYVPDITINDINKRAEKAKTEDKSNLYNYYKKLENDIKSSNNEDLYSNRIIMKNMLDVKIPTSLLSFYLNDFLEVTSFIDQIIDDLINNIILLPNSIKFICKVISILIKNKFKEITNSEINAFISKFIIHKLLIPIISVPNFKALISEFVISGNSIKNLKIFNFIVKKMFSGKLFINNEKEGDYTPFNWYFMDKMETILYFFEKVTSINLPNFIEKYIRNELPKEYKYEYFNENKDQFYANISLCFSLNNLNYLLKGLPEDDIILNEDNPINKKLKIIVSRLNIENIMNNVNENKNNKEKKEKNKQKENQVENYFLYRDKEIDKKYSKIFSINNNISNSYFKKEDSKNLGEKEKNIIKVKNYFCYSLGNYRLLNKSDFSIESTSNIMKMLNEIKTYMRLPYFILNNNTIPSIWYISSLLNYLNKIPKDYKENDFKKLFDELTINLKESINDLDISKIILLRNKLKFIDKINNYYEEMYKSINNIIINDNIKNIVETFFIPIDITFRYDNKEKKFDLKKSNLKEKDFEERIIHGDNKKKNFSLKTIEAFTRYFPNLSKYQYMQDINPLDIIKEISINQKINDYFEIIKERLIRKNVIELNSYKNFYEEKIKNYIMNKIYENIYPAEPDKKDVEFFKKTSSLSWVDPFRILEKEYVFDNLLPDILNEFNQIGLVKTPYQKLKCINNILNSVINIIQFNEGLGKKIGSDDINPVLNYVSIKAHPFRLYTDIEFIKIFTEKYGENENSLLNLESIFYYILESNAETYKLSEEEYKKKCIDAIKNKENNDELRINQNI